MSSETEAIQRQMEDTRASLAEKLGMLESQMSEKVEGATTKVSETVEAVSESVQAVEETVGSLEHAFDLQWHAERHPWLLVGGAVAVGFLGSRLLFPPRQREAARPAEWDQPAPLTREEPAAEERGEPAPEERTHPIDEDVNYLRQVGVGSAMGVLGKVLSTVLPMAVAPLVSEAVKVMTSRLGGCPVEEPVSQQPPPEGAVNPPVM